MVKFEDRVAIAKILEAGHSIFRQFWDIGSPTLTNSKDMDTACVAFDLEGNNVAFLWDETFWDSLDVYTRAFIAAHEMLHVILNHGKRMLTHKDDERSNQAMDIVVNHTLVNDFGFDREKLCIDWNNYCWVDTLFTPENQPSDRKSYEFYYNLLEELGESGGGSKLMDSHGVDAGELGEVFSPNDQGKIAGDLQEYMSPNDFDQKIKDVIDAHGEESEELMAGKGIGAWIDIHQKHTRKIIKKWEKIVTSTRKRRVYDFHTFNTWIRDNRRMSSIMEDDPSIFLETEVNMEGYHMKPRYTTVWFFLDHSGSCKQYADRFIAAALSLDLNKFKLNTFTFDTTCKEVDIKLNKIYGGGGTTFTCIEEAIQTKMEDDNVKHPDVVYIITDGYGNAVNPQHPEKWHWFLTNDASVQYIPTESKIHKLEEFE
jgi:hypothetical protein|tara:strand:- start:19986 stop:21266 length:1281 start_codon:yes stop_codon:yes gene_type:complete